ncbi:hypothetical protein M3Y97_00310900 [Aphelenchoides bicaudatus]|nr:hypothetical protein M3Y97_00310900 [Aphelenchoides bicaudatus]
MRLPVVSMEDDELFPKSTHTLRGTPTTRHIGGECLESFLNIPDQVWWSRLVIAVRGYVINIVRKNDEHLFSLDDAFMLIHKVFAERQKTSMSPEKFITHLNTLLSLHDFMDILNSVDPANFGYMETHPFLDQPYNTAFEAFFGNAQLAKNLHLANLQKLAFDVFARLLNILLSRFTNEQKDQQRNSIRFERDPEWQADDKVVLFEEFYEGNRTWVLLDFDRYILDFWRPNGVQIIFGDMYVEKKQRAGFNLCEYCGMLEQSPQQFPKYNEKRFCSEHCFTAILDKRR